MNSGLILRKAVEAIQRAKEQGIYEKDLLKFAEYVWPVVEPAIPFVKGWAIEAISEHLQAVTEGHIRRLLINVPPGFTKSLMTDVFWPAYEWGPRNMPWLRYMCAAYSNHLTERDNMRCRNIVVSDRYKHFWGNRFKISNEQFTKIKFANDQTGWKLATSVGGIGTGERADRVICFPFGELIHTSRGLRKIGEIVRRREQTDVLSFDIKSKKSVYRPIIGWHRNPQSRLLRLVLSNGEIIHCTPDHRFLVNGEWIRACELVGKFLSVARASDAVSNAIPSTAGSYGIDSSSADTVFSGKNPSGISNIFSNFFSLLSRKDGQWSSLQERKGAVSLAVGNVLGAGSILQITDSIVQRMTVFMSGVVSGRALAYKCPGNQNVNVKMKCLSIASEVKTLIRNTSFFPKRWLKYSFWLYEKAKSIPNLSLNALYSTVSRGLIIRKSRNPFPNLCVVAIEDGGHVDATYCLTIKDTHTFCVGGTPVIVANCDDPNNPMEMESEAVRNTARMWFTEVIPDRLNSQKDSAIVVIQQRTHEDDVSGIALSREMGYTHLMIPMRYDPGRHCRTIIGFDPKTKEDKIWEDPRHEEGELAWPERFPAQIADELERDKGPYAFHGQYQQMPAPRGGSILKDHFWQLWDQDKYPQFEFILASLDTAMTAKDENDPSALTIWGVFRDDKSIDVEAEALWMPRNGQAMRPVKGNPRVMLLWAWKEHLEFHDLVQKVINTCVPTAAPVPHPRFPVDRILIENKSNGNAVANELERMFRGSGRIGIEIVDPKQYGDKVARAISVQHIFSDGMVYAPDKAWADMVIKQCALFPRGSEDDLVDTVTQAIRWLRETGFVLKEREHDLAQEEELTYHNLQPLYPMA